MIDLPVMQCDPNCGKCCGPVLCTNDEYNAVAKHVRDHKITPLRNGPDRCPFYQQGQCAVYEARPFPCRLFGHVPSMTCCNGHNVNISKKQERRAMARYAERRGCESRSLHEFAYGPDAFRMLADHLEITRQ